MTLWRHTKPGCYEIHLWRVQKSGSFIRRRSMRWQLLRRGADGLFALETHFGTLREAKAYAERRDRYGN